MRILRFSILIMIFAILSLGLTGCASEEKRQEWVTAQMEAIPEIKVPLDDIAQITSEVEVSSRYGSHYERDPYVMLKFKFGSMDIEKNFKPTQIKVVKDLKPDDKSFVTLKFVDIDIISEESYSIERGMYDIVAHLPGNYFVREVDNRKHLKE